MKKILIGSLFLFANAEASTLPMLELGTYSGLTPNHQPCTLTISGHSNTSVVDGSSIPLYDFSIRSEKLSELPPALQEGNSNLVSAVDEDISSQELVTWALIDGFAVEDSIVDSIQFSGMTPVSYTAVTTHKNIFGKLGTPQMNTDCSGLTKN